MQQSPQCNFKFHCILFLENIPAVSCCKCPSTPSGCSVLGILSKQLALGHTKLGTCSIYCSIGRDVEQIPGMFQVRIHLLFPLLTEQYFHIILPIPVEKQILECPHKCVQVASSLPVAKGEMVMFGWICIQDPRPNLYDFAAKGRL